jgi:hypothetical protein
MKPLFIPNLTSNRRLIEKLKKDFKVISCILKVLNMIKRVEILINRLKTSHLPVKVIQLSILDIRTFRASEQPLLKAQNLSSCPFEG